MKLFLLNYGPLDIVDFAPFFSINLTSKGQFLDFLKFDLGLFRIRLGIGLGLSVQRYFQLESSINEFEKRVILTIFEAKTNFLILRSLVAIRYCFGI